MSRRLAWLIVLSVAETYAQQYAFIHVPNSLNDWGRLLEDHRGRLWISAHSGLLFCFDGSIFYRLKGLEQGTTLSEDSEGGLWIASGSDLYRYYDGVAHLISKGIGSVRSVIEIKPGLQVISSGPPSPGSGNAAARLIRAERSGTLWKLDRITDSSIDGPISADHDGILNFACPGGWCQISFEELRRWRPHTDVKLTFHPIDGAGTFGVRTVIRDRRGCVWYRTENDAKYQCPGDSRFQTLPNEIASANGEGDISETPDGSILIVGQSSVAIGVPGHFLRVSPANGLPVALNGLMGKDGTIWLSTARGLYRFMYPFRLEYWNARDGLVMPDSITRVGDKILAASGRGVYQLSSDKKTWSALPINLEFAPFWQVLPTERKTLLLLAPRGLAEVQLDGTVLARTPPASGIWGAHMAQTPDGQLWMSGLGVSRILRRGRVLVKQAESVPEPRQNGPDIEVDSKTGVIAACYGGGLTSRIDGVWHTISTKDGLVENYCRSLAAHPNGSIWYAYNTDRGFAVIRRNVDKSVNIRQFPGDPDTPSAGTFFDVDRRGWLWRGGEKGVRAADASDAEQGNWLYLNDSDGLPFVDSNQQSFFGDQDGSVWWGANNSIIHFNPASDFVRPQFSPSINVSGYSINGGPPEVADEVHSLRHGSNITAHIGSLQFDRRNALRVRYRILPEQTAWKESQSLDLPLGVPRWGDHTIEVQARLGTGPWSHTVTRSLTVLRPFWVTWPFLLALCSIGAATGFTIYRWERRRRQIKQLVIPDISALRTDALALDAHDLLGSTLGGRYLLNHVLGQGGFATVFDGYDRRQDCRCAVKILRPEMADAELAKRFEEEVEALEAVTHPNIVRIYGHGHTPLGLPFLVMEFIEGETLREAITPGGMPLREVAALLRQAGHALGALHAHGICHRDLKPENLMVRASGPPERKLVVIDFSIAILKSPDKTMQGLARAAGTIQYMAPEQLMGSADPPCDIYSLSKVLIEMITGRRLSELLPDASRDLPARVGQMIGSMKWGLSPESIALIAGALNYVPEMRPANVITFAETIASDLEVV